MIKESDATEFIDIFNYIADKAMEHAKSKGFHENWNDGEKLALIHSEVSEVLEALRNKEGIYRDKHCPEFLATEIEMADVIIRCMDFAMRLNMRIGEAIIAKMEYNSTRPYKHGKAW